MWDWQLGASSCAKIRRLIWATIKDDVERQKITGGKQHRYVGLYLKMEEDLCPGGRGHPSRTPLREETRPRTLAQVSAALKRRVNETGGPPAMLTDVAALPVFRGVNFAHLEKAAQQLAAKREIRYDGVRVSMVSARVSQVELREIKRDLVGPFTITSEGEENIYFKDGGGSPYFFKHEGSEAQRSGFFKAIGVKALAVGGGDTVPARKAAKKKAAKKVTAKRKVPLKKKPAKRTRTRAEEARAKRLAKKNAAARRKKSVKKKAPRVQRSPAEEQKILNAWKRGAGAV